MASGSSPAISEKSGVSGSGFGSTASPVSSARFTTAQRSDIMDPPKQNQRGLNKPKCIQCGNIARARCPFQSCKGCCVKAENPCHIHVLKQPQSILPDKVTPSPASTLSEQPSTITSSAGAALRLSSLRQLSNTFASTLRTKKPLSHKDIININKWRFSKLKEHIEGDIEIEDEAFDRYMQNVSLLKETFIPTKTVDDDIILPDGTPEQSTSVEFKRTVRAIKARLQSKVDTTKNFREKIQGIVDQGLKDLQRSDDGSIVDDEDKNDDIAYDDDLCSLREPKIRRKIMDIRIDRAAVIDDLLDKLSKARTEDELNSCLDIKLRLFNWDINKNNRSTTSMDEEKGEDALEVQSSPSTPATSSSARFRCFCTRLVDQEILSNIEAQCSSHNGMVQL